MNAPSAYHVKVEELVLILLNNRHAIVCQAIMKLIAKLV